MNINEFAKQQNTSFFAQQPIFSAFVEVLVFPLKTLYAVFDSFMLATSKKMTYNAQTCYLQKLLNDNFDNVERRIYIEDVPSIPWIIAYPTLSDKPIILGQKILRPSSLYGNNYNKFIVYVPTELSSLEGIVRGLTSQYKLAGKGFLILYF